ncbi:hypothetical protein H4R34_003553 [Dimargaris verticillata]|uniref:ADF-H domain-containing protein n=1 Tax=Dimargaris verticillata TaxID=2761393 RepID=A0A9W8B5V3_9FUNG|nr:hypothetical protein H4R34_003553 [Dimargaris verticillata]
MSCDLSDPSIIQAYNEVVGGEVTNWLLLGYNDTRDVISLYGKGTGGLAEFASQIRNEVLFGLLRLDKVNILIQHISVQVSGVRRARGLVHGRAVANLLKDHDLQLIIASAAELTPSNIRSKIKSSNIDIDIDDEGWDEGVSQPLQQSPKPASTKSSSSQQLAASPSSDDALPTPVATPIHHTSSPKSVSASPPLPRGSPAASTNGATSPVAEPVVISTPPTADSPVVPLPPTDVEDRQPYGLPLRKSPLEPVPADAGSPVGNRSLTPSTSSSPHMRASSGYQHPDISSAELNNTISDKFFEAEMAKRQTLKAQLEKDTKRGQDCTLSGFVVVQGGNSCSTSPTDALDLKRVLGSPQNAEEDVLIPNSFQVDFHHSGTYLFYTDEPELKMTFIRVLMSAMTQ